MNMIGANEPAAKLMPAKFHPTRLPKFTKRTRKFTGLRLLSDLGSKAKSSNAKLTNQANHKCASREN